MTLRGFITNFCILLPAILVSSGPLHAQDAYPSKPIRMIIGLAAGGNVDITARRLAKKLSDQMSVPVIADNRAGANGAIAHGMVAKSAPDGYTIVFNSGGIVQSHALSSKISYDPVKDFAPVALFSSTPMTIVVDARLPIRNMAEFVSYGKANPGKMSYGSAGTGNISHLAALLLLKATGVTATHIPYKGASPALADLIGGQIQFTIASPPSMAAFLKDPRIRAIAVMSGKRSSALPDVPTIAEAGYPDVEAGSWLGVMAPAGTSDAIVRKLNSETLKALRDPELRAALIHEGSEPLGSTPEQYATYIKSELARWTRIIKDENLSLD